ncbi:MAG: hypothetical protein ABJA84_10190 [Polaromonas sp.]
MRSPIYFRLFQPARLNRWGKGVASFGLASLMAMTAATAQTASGSSAIDNTGNAKSEMAACTSGKSQQNRATCMKEVHAANAAKRAGKLGTGADYVANALKRCEVFKTSEDQAACRSRVGSQATLDGSVASGGILREGEITVPADASMKAMPMHSESPASADTMPMPMHKPQAMPMPMPRRAPAPY